MYSMCESASFKGSLGFFLFGFFFGHGGWKTITYPFYTVPKRANLSDLTTAWPGHYHVSKHNVILLEQLDFYRCFSPLFRRGFCPETDQRRYKVESFQQVS